MGICTPHGYYYCYLAARYLIKYREGHESVWRWPVM